MKICEDNRGEAVMCILMTPHEIVGISHRDGINVTAKDFNTSNAFCKINIK